jgi:hemerythrin
MMATVSAPLVWDDSYATGVAEIDEQHMILVHTLNQASEKLAIDGSVEQLAQITQDLLSYALYHFETEEDLMQEYGYEVASAPDAESHLKQHRSFSAKVVSVRDGLKSGTPISPSELLDFLNNWLVNHILNTDQKLGAFIRERRG